MLVLTKSLLLLIERSRPARNQEIHEISLLSGLKSTHVSPDQSNVKAPRTVAKGQWCHTSK